MIRANSKRLSGCLLLLSLSAPGIAEDVVIHRCTLADGTVAFQEMPCAEEEKKDVSESSIEIEEEPSSDPFFDFENPFDEAADEVVVEEAAPQRPLTTDRAECEKTARDAIDAIDAEMRKPYGQEQGQRYLTELMSLTAELRACKQQ